MDAPPLVQVRRLGEAEVPGAAAMFARAFNDDPLNVVLLPTPPRGAGRSRGWSSPDWSVQ